MCVCARKIKVNIYRLPKKVKVVKAVKAMELPFIVQDTTSHKTFILPVNGILPVAANPIILTTEQNINESESILVTNIATGKPYSFLASAVEERAFRNSLDKLDRKKFDGMFSIAHLYNSASSYAANPIQIQPIFMSIILHHYKQLVIL